MTIVEAKFNTYFSFKAENGQYYIYTTNGGFYSYNREQIASIILELEDFLKTDAFKLFLEENKLKIISVLKERLKKEAVNFNKILNMSSGELLKHKNSILLFDPELLKELTHFAIHEMIIEQIIT